MGTSQSKSKEKDLSGQAKENSASPKKGSVSPKKEQSASPKKEKRKSTDISEKQSETALPQQNGDHAVQSEEGAVPRRNGTAAEKKMKKRTSFYETVDASEVLPYLIIGNLASSKDEEFLARKNVKYILNLTPDSEEPAGEVEYKNVPLEDDDDQEILPFLDSCFEFINKAGNEWKSDSNNNGVVLVHSYFGMSRSSTVVIAYLMKQKKWSLREAYDHIKEKHSSVNPNDNFAVQLIRYEQEMFDHSRTMSVIDFRH